MTPWRLLHAWTGEGDRAALACCREALAAQGIDLVDARETQPFDAVKAHGMELLATLADEQPLHDLHRAACDGAWERSLPPFMRRFTSHGDQWYGVPMGVHRANLAWLNGGLVARLGLPEGDGVAGLADWLTRASRHVAKPLAVGAEPWQVGLVFENVVLACLGVDGYRRAFELRDSTMWSSPGMKRAVECFMSLRQFVDDNHFTGSWDRQLARVIEGEAGMQIMGDWVRGQAGDGVTECTVPGTANRFNAIVDYFVPIRHGDPDLQDRVATALMDRALQTRFAIRKGCMPAVVTAWDDVDPQRADVLRRPGAVVLSLTLEQCCPLDLTRQLTATAARHFIAHGEAAVCWRALSEVAVESR